MTSELVPVAVALDALRSAGALPSPLVPEGALRQIGAAAALLPVAMDAAGFEARLGGGDGRVDFATLTDVMGPGPGVLEAIGSEPGNRLAAIPAWRAVARFCRAWRQPRVAARVPFLILEFDVLPGAEAPPVPSVFLRVAVARGRVVEETEPLLEELLGETPDDATLRRLRDCRDRLPAGGELLQVGSMLSRDGALRLYLSHPTKGVGRFLEQVGWPGDAGSFQALADRHCDQGGTAEFQVELAPDVRPRASLDLAFGSPDPRVRASRLRRQLDRLLAEGLCSDAERTACAGWPSRHEAAAGPRGWPCRIDTEVSHLKIAVEEGRPPEAKCYFYFVPRWPFFDSARAPNPGA